MSQMTGGEAIVKSLESQGVEYVFGMAGHANLAFLDPLIDSEIKFITVPHEQIAAHAADAYFRVTHKPAVVTTTVGPGATNVIAGMADALLDSSAMVVICGGIPSFYSGTGGYQEMNEHGEDQQFELFRPVTKRVFRVAHASLLPHVISNAFNYALSGNPGPVMVHVPLDFLSYKSDYELRDLPAHRPSTKKILADPNQVHNALDLLVSAEKPLIFAGNGVLLSEASTQLTSLAEYLNVPVATTMSGQGAINSEHPLSAGFTGVVGTPVANALARDADVIMAIGTRMPEMDTSSWSSENFFNSKQSKLIHIDINSYEIGKIYPVEVGVVGDASSVLQQMIDEVPNFSDPKTSTPWVEGMIQEKQKWFAELAEFEQSAEKPICVERLLGDVRDSIDLASDGKGVLISGVGIRHAAGQHFRFKTPGTHIVGSGYSTMGQEVAAALGAKLGNPEVPVVAVVGDGAFRSTLQTVTAAVEFKIPVVWVVMNNYSYNIIAFYQNRHWKRLTGTEFRIEDEKEPYNPDFAAFARSVGAGGKRIDNPEDLRPAIDEAIKSEIPYVLDVITTDRPRARASGYWDVNDVLSSDWDGIAP